MITLDSDVGAQIAGILALIGFAVVRLLADAGHTTESSPESKVSVIQTVINKAVAIPFQSAAFQTAKEFAVYKCVVESPVVNPFETCTIDTPTFTVFEAKYFQHEIEKKLLEKANWEERFINLCKTVDEKKSKQEDGPFDSEDGLS